MAKFNLPAGTYWIGDPCYVVTKYHDTWIKVITSVDYFNEPALANVDDITIVAGTTSYGDGCYTSNAGTYHNVDSGTLGIVPLATVNKFHGNHTWLAKQGTFKHFDRDFTVEIDQGHFDFDQIIIDTREDYDFACEYAD